MFPPLSLAYFGEQFVLFYMHQLMVMVLCLNELVLSKVYFSEAFTIQVSILGTSQNPSMNL